MKDLQSSTTAELLLVTQISVGVFCGLVHDSLIDVHSFIHSGYFYSASSSPLLLSIDTVSELTFRSAIDNCE